MLQILIRTGRTQGVTLSTFKFASYNTKYTLTLYQYASHISIMY